MHRKLIALAAAISLALLVSGVAAGSITLFEPILFHPGVRQRTDGQRPRPLEELSHWDD